MPFLHSSSSSTRPSAKADAPPPREPLNNARTDVIATVESLPDHRVKARKQICDAVAITHLSGCTVFVSGYLCFGVDGCSGSDCVDGCEDEVQRQDTGWKIGFDLEHGDCIELSCNAGVLFWMLSATRLPCELEENEMVTTRCY